MTPPTRPTALTVWRSILGYEGRYEVSSDGLVRSTRTLRKLKPTKDTKGYLRVSLSKNRTTHPTRKIHVLVLSAFRGPCPPDHQGAHLNGQPSDNRVDNLIWTTAKVNAEHRAMHGRTANGTRHGSAKLTPAGVRLIRQLRSEGKQGAEIAEIVGISPSQVWKVASGQYWKTV